MKKIKYTYLLLIPFVFLFGSLLHFTYDLFNHNTLIGLFSAVNESTWEHTKLLVLPYIIYYFIIILTNKEINKSKFMRSILISLIISIVTIPILFYFVRYGLDIENLFIDILIFLVSIIAGTFKGYHYYIYNNSEPNYYISVISIILVLILYVVFTFNPPKIPLFEDPISGTYGINR